MPYTNRRRRKYFKLGGTFSRNRYRRSRRTRSLPMTKRRMPKYVVPDQVIVKMPLTASYTINQATDETIIRFSMNNIHSPQNLPAGQDYRAATSLEEYSYFYRHYQVIGMGVHVFVTNIGDIDDRIIGAMGFTETADAGTVDAFRQNPSSKTLRIGARGTSNTTGQGYVYSSLSKVLGRTALDRDYTGDTAAFSANQPVRNAWFNLLLKGLEDPDNYACSCKIRLSMTYYVKLWARYTIPVGTPLQSIRHPGLPAEEKKDDSDYEMIESKRSKKQKRTTSSVVDTTNRLSSIYIT